MKLQNALSIPNLINVTKNFFSTEIKDERDSSKRKRTLFDYLMSGLAVFHLKYASLLQFDKDSKLDSSIKNNLNTLYGIESVPSDTQMREVLDNIDPRELRKIFKKFFSMIQRQGKLKQFLFFDNYYLLAIDGTGYFSSEKVHCDSCCSKKHRDGRITYYHQFLCGALIHPDKKAVIPLAPEPILIQDGATKNDCERNAAVRFLKDLRKEHPHLKIIVTEDGLASNAPHIYLLKDLDLSFILGAKSGDHKFLFEILSDATDLETVMVLEVTDGKKIHHFRWINKVSLNESNPDCVINFLDYHEFNGDKDPIHFSWVTDIELNKSNVMQIMRAGRARWGIENEVFNTLKNQGYNFDHNFGHGYKNLSVVMAFLMTLAFLIDQIGQLECEGFQNILKVCETKKNLWRMVLTYFLIIEVPSWEIFYDLLLNKKKFSYTQAIDTS